MTMSHAASVTKVSTKSLEFVSKTFVKLADARELGGINNYVLGVRYTCVCVYVCCCIASTVSSMY